MWSILVVLGTAVFAGAVTVALLEQHLTPRVLHWLVGGGALAAAGFVGQRKYLRAVTYLAFVAAVANIAIQTYPQLTDTLLLLGGVVVFAAGHLQKDMGIARVIAVGVLVGGVYVIATVHTETGHPVSVFVVTVVGIVCLAVSSLIAVWLAPKTAIDNS